MEELRVEELVGSTEALVEDVAEDVVEKAGMSFIAKAGVVGVVLVGVAATAYGVAKYVKAKKAKKNVDGGEDVIVDFAELKDETEETN